MKTQGELAQDLVHEMHTSGDERSDITAIDLLDDLACAGLMLVPDTENVATAEYMAQMIESPPLRSPDAKHVILHGNDPVRTRVWSWVQLSAAWFWLVVVKPVPVLRLVLRWEPIEERFRD